MSIILWIGFAFLVTFIVLFVVMMYFPPKNYDPGIVRLFAALCAGFSVGLLTGGALFDMEGQLSNGLKIGISGSSGVALFFVVWFFWPRVDRRLPEGMTVVNIPKNCPFEAAVKSIAKSGEGFVQFQGFSPAELVLKLDEGTIRAASIKGALEKARFLCNRLPAYTVSLKDGVYTLARS